MARKIRTDEDNFNQAKAKALVCFIETLYEMGYSLEQIAKWSNEIKLFPKEISKQTINYILKHKDIKKEMASDEN